jgi:hypothetical protein
MFVVKGRVGRLVLFLREEMFYASPKITKSQRRDLPRFPIGYVFGRTHCNRGSRALLIGQGVLQIAKYIAIGATISNDRKVGCYISYLEGGEVRLAKEGAANSRSPRTRGPCFVYWTNFWTPPQGHGMHEPPNYLGTREGFLSTVLIKPTR